METKLNSYILTDKVKNDMKNALSISRQVKKEVGLTMCSDKDNVITLRGEQEDKNHEISIMRKCDEGEEYVGYYHTHPGSDSRASSVDLMTCGTSKALCVGGRKKGQEQGIDNVNCYIWKDKVISVQKGEQLFTRVLAGMKGPRNPEYKSHFNCLDTIGRYAEEQVSLDKESKSIMFDPLRKLSIMSRFEELKAMTEQETYKYYNRIEIKLKED